MKYFLLLSPLALAMWGQAPNPSETGVPNAPSDIPTFHVTTTARTVSAINFNHREGSTALSLVGTSLMPKAIGDVKVDSKVGATKIDVHLDKLEPAQIHGDSFLTYVLWAITPEGRPENLGEIVLSGNEAHLQAATELQAFGLIVTAEPYFAVTQPSDTVVMEGVVKSGPENSTTGTISPINAKYELLEHGAYDAVLPAADRAILKQRNDTPLDLKEARQAMAIARGVGALTYASDTMQRAKVDLINAENFWNSRKDTKRVQTLARNVTQLAEDARLITVRKVEDQRLAQERQAAENNVAASKSEADRQAGLRVLAETERRQALEREAEAKAAAQHEATLRAWAESQQAQLAQARLDAEQLLAKTQTELAETRSTAEADRARLESEKEAANRKASEADAARAAAEQERLKLRNQLRDQLNRVLQTQDTARGLIVNMSDVLFDTGQYTLKPGAREKLAKVSGILLAHPDLKVQVEGHTDSTGSDEFNQKLSENRAKAVQDYLVAQGIAPESVTSAGFGKTRPVATNATAAGRQQNRRVEMVVAGESIQAAN